MTRQICSHLEGQIYPVSIYAARGLNRKPLILYIYEAPAV